MKLPFFSREFLESLPDENDDAIVAITNEYHGLFQKTGGGGSDQDYLEVYAILQAFIEARKLKFSLPAANPPNVPRGEIVNILSTQKTAAEKRIYERESLFHLSRNRMSIERYSRKPIHTNSLTLNITEFKNS